MSQTPFVRLFICLIFNNKINISIAYNLGNKKFLEKVKKRSNLKNQGEWFNLIFWVVKHWFQIKFIKKRKKITKTHFSRLFWFLHWFDLMHETKFWIQNFILFKKTFQSECYFVYVCCIILIMRYTEMSKRRRKKNTLEIK